MTLDTHADLFDEDVDAVAEGLDLAARRIRERSAVYVRTADLYALGPASN